MDNSEVWVLVIVCRVFLGGHFRAATNYIVCRRVTHHIDIAHGIIYEFYSRTKTVIRNIFYFNILWPI